MENFDGWSLTYDKIKHIIESKWRDNRDRKTRISGVWHQSNSKAVHCEEVVDEERGRTEKIWWIWMPFKTCIFQIHADFAVATVLEANMKIIQFLLELTKDTFCNIGLNLNTELNNIRWSELHSLTPFNHDLML